MNASTLYKRERESEKGRASESVEEREREIMWKRE